MQFSDWEPIYEQILAEFGYPRSGDERARGILAELVDGQQFDVDGWSLAGDRVAIAGGAPSLATAEELSMARNADAVIAASTAADVLFEAGITVDCMVTDIDKNPETARQLTERGVPVAVHAHGDNSDLLREYLPTYEHSAVIPTTQAAPTETVRNFGGFTDGDRAAYLADYCGADELVFPGWEFSDPAVEPEKRKKLRWAARLLLKLERQREETFAVLDDIRTEISYPIVRE